MHSKKMRNWDAKIITDRRLKESLLTKLRKGLLTALAGKYCKLQVS